MSTLLLLFILVSNSIIKNKEELFLLPNHQTSLILGHSHAACSLNDSILPGFKNLAAGGEAYLYTFLKLKQLVKHNPQIKTVYIEFSNNQISKRMDSWTWEKPKCEWSFPKYFFNSSWKENKKFLEKNPLVYLSTLHLALKQNLKMMIYSENLISNGKWGGYEKLTKEMSTNTSEKNKEEEPTEDFSEVNLSYLAECLNFCKEQKLDVYLIRSPLHSSYTLLKNENAFQNILKERFNKIQFLDFLNFPIPTRHFNDAEHLNEKGALEFTFHFKTVTNNKPIQNNF